MGTLRASKLAILITGLFLILVGACSSTSPEQIEEIEPLNLAVKEHFFAHSPEGALVEVMGQPDRIVEHEGKARVRMNTEEGYQYLDPLAIESEFLGEHPSEKLYRLERMGIPMSIDLSDDLFHTLEFEYLAGKEMSGVISEVFPDGTFLVIPDSIPSEWKTSGAVAPSLFHVDPRALISKTSHFIQEYEGEVFSLPQAEWIDPPVSSLLKACSAYQESLVGSEYLATLFSAGYDIAPPEFSLLEVLQRNIGAGKSYFGFNSSWIANRVRELGITEVNECDIVHSIREFSLLVGRLPQEQGVRETDIVRTDAKESGEVVYTVPGRVLTANPVSDFGTSWIISADGWEESVRLIDTENHDISSIIAYPPLYGTSAQFDINERFLYMILYGFENEEGGLWVADVWSPEFPEQSTAMTQIVPWDHALQWFVLEEDNRQSPPVRHIFLTAKEVDDNFSMTATSLRVTTDGLDSEAVHQERLLKMSGWNPVAFAIQRLGEHQYRVLVETHFNYENSFIPRAKGVYIVPVDTSE